MKELKRIKVGNFKIEESISITELEKNKENSIQIEELEKYILENSITLDNLEKYLTNKGKSFITIEKYFNNKKSIQLDNRKLKLFLNGVQLTYPLEDEIYKIYNNNNFIGIGTIKNELLKREIIIEK